MTGFGPLPKSDRGLLMTAAAMRSGFARTADADAKNVFIASVTYASRKQRLLNA
jgi:hypothetical protein